MAKMFKRIRNRAEHIRGLSQGHLDRQFLLSSGTSSNTIFKIVQEIILNNYEKDILETTGLIYVRTLRHIVPDMSQLTALTENWNSNTNTFDLRTVGEITVTLEDVYRIMHVPISGQTVRLFKVRARHEELTEWLTGSIDNYDRCKKGCRLREPLEKVRDDDEDIFRIRMIIAAIILHLLYPDRSGEIFPLGLVHIVKSCIEHSRQYAWGRTILAQLYRDLSRCADSNGKTIFHAPLFQIWAFEHITITRPRGTPHAISHSELPNWPYWKRWTPYNYRHCEPCDVEYWRKKFDNFNLTHIVWRPYLDNVWPEDRRELEKVDVCGELDGHKQFVETYYPDRVPRQFELPLDATDPQGRSRQGASNDFHDPDNVTNPLPNAAASILPPSCGEGGTGGDSRYFPNVWKGGDEWVDSDFLNVWNGGDEWVDGDFDLGGCSQQGG